MRYRINEPMVVNEVFDGEAIIINLDTGNYYSLLGTATYIWEALAAGHDILMVSAVLSSLAQGIDAQTDVTAFVDHLLTEGLVIGDEGATVRAPLKPPPASYESPQLSKFTDLQTLLLLDPIHEVEEEGWPRAPRQD
jgi:hypothetical protein